MKTGIELIATERYEQFIKHGYNLDHDNSINNDCELQSAAAWLLTGDPSKYPKGWDNKLWDKMTGRVSHIKKLVVAGALLAAEIDRLNEQ